MERKNVEHLFIHVEVATCVTMEFNNLLNYYQKKMLPNKKRNKKKNENT